MHSVQESQSSYKEIFFSGHLQSVQLYGSRLFTLTHISHTPVKMSGNWQKCHDETNYACMPMQNLHSLPINIVYIFIGLLSNDTDLIITVNS